MLAPCQQRNAVTEGTSYVFATTGAVFVQYGVQRKKPRLTTKSGKTRHLMFRKRAEGKD